MNILTLDLVVAKTLKESSAKLGANFAAKRQALKDQRAALKAELETVTATPESE